MSYLGYLRSQRGPAPHFPQTHGLVQCISTTRNMSHDSSIIVSCFISDSVVVGEDDSELLLSAERVSQGRRSMAAPGGVPSGRPVPRGSRVNEGSLCQARRLGLLWPRPYSIVFAWALITAIVHEESSA